LTARLTEAPGARPRPDAPDLPLVLEVVGNALGTGGTGG
jgi:hypothetical protein